MRLVTFPSHNVLLKRLQRACNNNAHLEQKLFPQILEKAGEQMCPDEAALFLHSALKEYFKNLPASVQQQVISFLSQLVKAVVEDAGVATEVTFRLNRSLSQKQPR